MFAGLVLEFCNSLPGIACYAADWSSLLLEPGAKWSPLRLVPHLICKWFQVENFTKVVVSPLVNGHRLASGEGHAAHLICHQIEVASLIVLS